MSLAYPKKRYWHGWRFNLNLYRVAVVREFCGWSTKPIPRRLYGDHRYLIRWWSHLAVQHLARKSAHTIQHNDTSPTKALHYVSEVCWAFYAVACVFYVPFMIKRVIMAGRMLGWHTAESVVFRCTAVRVTIFVQQLRVRFRSFVTIDCTEPDLYFFILSLFFRQSIRSSFPANKKKDNKLPLIQN